MRFSKIKKILVFKLCCLGDIIFMTPLIAKLKKNFPDAEIYLIASSWVEKLVPYLKHIDRTIIYNPPVKRGIFSKFAGFIKLIRLLRKQKFDMAYLGHRANIFGLSLKLSGIKYRLGFRGTKFLNYTVKFDENIHETKRYLKVLEEKGIETDPNKPELKKDRDIDEIKKEYNIQANKFIIGIFPFGGINPGTKMDIKRWSYERYIELVKTISRRFQETLILLFEGTEENEKIEKADSHLRANDRIIKINIDLISICDIFISGDTGPLHIAGALNIPTLGIFGPSNPELVNPPGELHKYIWKKPICSPCYTPATAIDRNNKKYWKGDNFICNVGTHICMKDISAEEIFKELEGMIKKLEILTAETNRIYTD